MSLRLLCRFASHSTSPHIPFRLTCRFTSHVVSPHLSLRLTCRFVPHIVSPHMSLHFACRFTSHVASPHMSHRLPYRLAAFASHVTSPGICSCLYIAYCVQNSDTIPRLPTSDNVSARPQPHGNPGPNLPNWGTIHFVFKNNKSNISASTDHSPSSRLPSSSSRDDRDGIDRLDRH